MQIALIAAMAKNRVIGRNGQMPWHLPADLKHFKKITLHKPIVMGRKTFESIGRPLPKRRNIVISGRSGLTIPEVEVYSSLEDMLYQLRDESEIMIIGGQVLFEQMLGMANKMYLTVIDAEITGDTYFPLWNQQEWQVVQRVLHEVDAENPLRCEFIEYLRVNEK